MKEDMKVAVKSQDNTSAGEVTLPADVFSAPINKNVVYEAMKQHMAAKRQGTASVKTVGTVHGTTAKPWRQKGTGRARAGSSKSPLWRGGAVTFGPQPRDFGYSIPKKVSRAAFCSVFSLLAKREKISVVKDIVVNGYKTRDVVDVFQAIIGGGLGLKGKRRILYLVATPPAEAKEAHLQLRKSAANIRWLRIVNTVAIEIKDLYYADHVFLSTSAVTALSDQAKVWTKKPTRARLDKVAETAESVGVEV